MGKTISGSSSSCFLPPLLLHCPQVPPILKPGGFLILLVQIDVQWASEQGHLLTGCRPPADDDHGRSEPVLHVESRHRSLLVFCSGVHQISWSRGRVVDADSFINLMRHRIFEEPLCLERELAFFSLVEKLLMFIKSVVLLSCLQARLVLVLPSNEASMRPSMVL